MLPPPRRIEGRQFTLVDKRADAVGIHFGFPIGVTRSDGDFFPLMVANSFFGEHRTFHGRLMQELRGKRGLNYGDYSYLEYWDNPPGTSNPPPNHPRREQYFSVWIRPVNPANDVFALKTAVFELQRLIDGGLTQSEFDLTRDFLISYSKLWARSLSDRLGFHMDSRFYGTPYFIDQIEARLRGMQVEEVNRAIRKHLQTADFAAVMITGNARDLGRRLTDDAPARITYDETGNAAVTTADRLISGLRLRPALVRIVPVEQTFMQSREVRK